MVAKWRLTNTVLANRHFASIEKLEDAQAERCVALQGRPDLIRSTTLFPRWPKRIGKRQGPRAVSRTYLASRHVVRDELAAPVAGLPLGEATDHNGLLHQGIRVSLTKKR